MNIFEELTKYELTATAKLHDIPGEVIEETWRDIARCIGKIPFETLDTTFAGFAKAPLLKAFAALLKTDIAKSPQIGKVKKNCTQS